MPAIHRLIWGLFCSFNSLVEQPVPVVFIHVGDTYYLSDILSQAQRYNQRVILIGDEAVKHYPVEYYPLDSYNDTAKKFAQIYRHASNNSYSYEIFCFQRWFILKKFMEEQGIPVCFHCDSDGMLYCDVNKVYANFNMFDVSLSLPDCNCVGCGHFSYWNWKALDIFCGVMTKNYQDSALRDALVANFKKGEWWTNVSDMTLLLKLAHSYTNECTIGKINKIIDDASFDHNIGIHEDHYELTDCILNDQKGQIKKITWIENQPHCVDLVSGKLIRLNALHFQGGYKALISQYTRPVFVS